MYKWIENESVDSNWNFGKNINCLPTAVQARANLILQLTSSQEITFSCNSLVHDLGQ